MALRVEPDVDPLDRRLVRLCIDDMSPRSGLLAPSNWRLDNSREGQVWLQPDAAPGLAPNGDTSTAGG